jgi:glycosyltransferase involved in cell wall biosynthesis
MDDNLVAHVPGLPARETTARLFLGRVYIGMFDVHLANSTYTAQELALAMRAPHVRPVYVAPPGVQPVQPVSGTDRRAARDRLWRRLGIPPDVPCLVYAGQLSAERHVHLLAGIVADVAEAVPDIRMLVIGEGPAVRGLARDAEAMAPGRVHLHPHVSDRAELLAVISSANVFVHPNHREPFGIGPLEAMACGVPVVLPRSGGVLTYATDENAWLAAAADPKVMASVVVEVLRSPFERAKRSAAGLMTAARFSWPAAASRMLALYAEIHAAHPDHRCAASITVANDPFE